MSATDENLFETMIRVENKDIFVDLKKNKGGVYLKISERNGGGRNTVLIPASGIPRLRSVLDEVSKTSSRIKSVSRERLNREAGDVARSLYVSGLTWDTTDEELFNHFAQAGSVVRAVVLRQRRGNNPRSSLGCGIVEFASADLALNAVHAMNDTELKGRKIRVREDRAAADEEVVDASGGGVVSATRQVRNVAAAAISRSDEERVAVPTKVFISGLAWEAKSEELAQYFGAVGTVVHAEAMVTKKGRPMGSGIVEFSDPSAVNLAVTQFHGQEFKGRKIGVRQYYQ